MTWTKVPFVELSEGEISRVRPAELRDAARRGECPYCGRSGLKMLGPHFFQCHGVTAQRVKEIVGTTRGAPLCMESTSVRFSERNARAGIQVDWTLSGGRPKGSSARPEEMERLLVAARARVRVEARTCGVCGETFSIKPSSKQRFCSLTCFGRQNETGREAARTANCARRLPPRDCVTCGRSTTVVIRGQCRRCDGYERRNGRKRPVVADARLLIPRSPAGRFVGVPT